MVYLFPTAIKIKLQQVLTAAPPGWWLIARTSFGDVVRRKLVNSVHVEQHRTVVAALAYLGRLSVGGYEGPWFKGYWVCRQ